MAGNDSPRLVKILIRLALNWVITKNRAERAAKRLRLAKASTARGGNGCDLDRLDEEALDLDAAYQDHPFPGFVRLVSHETGFDQEELRAASHSEFDGKREMVVALNALDENGTTGALFAKLWDECPEIASRLFGDGAEQSKLADLLGLAGTVFGLANELGGMFQEEMQSRSVFMAGDETLRQRYQEKINELVAAVLELRAPMQNPPDGAEAVVDQLRKAGRLAKRLAETNDTDIFGLFPDLRTVASDGYDAIKATREALPSNDPFGFLDEETKPPIAESPAPAPTEDVTFIDRLLAGPDDAELTPRELALLEAHLKQPISMAAIQQERRASRTGDSETVDRHSKLKLIRDFNRNLQRATVEGDAGDDQQEGSAGESATPKKIKKKKSTVRGEGQIKIVSALTKHHQYADGGCLNMTPIGNNELARLAEVSESTVSDFFNRQFNGGKKGGLAKYRAICGDAAKLVAALKLLNQEFSPHHLFGTKPPGEDEHDDE
jgi:hypothetical protein